MKLYFAALVLHNMTFRGNSAQDGGALHAGWGSSVSISQSVFINNQATGSVGNKAAEASPLTTAT